MAIEISGRSYDVTDRDRKLIEEKLGKVERYFTDIIDIRCVLSVEKRRNICEFFVVGKDYDVKSMQEAGSMDDAIVSTIDHLKTQARKNRKKITDHKRRARGATRVPGPDSWEVQVLERGKLMESRRMPRIVKTSTLPIRPMSIEEAAIELDDSRNEFIVFRDLDTEKVTVLYKRRDQNFGMIAPEF